MKLYILIQRLLKRQWVRCFVLFFILISIIAVIASSFEEMSVFRISKQPKITRNIQA